MCFWRRCFFNLASLLERLGTLLGHFGTLLGLFRVQKRAPKSSDAQQAAVFGSSEGSGRLPGTIFDGIGTILGCFLLDGSTIFAISTCSIFGKCWIWEAFWEAKSSQNPKKHAFKNMCYFSIVFFYFFGDFGSILGGRDAPAWSHHTPNNSLQTLIFSMCGNTEPQEGATWELTFQNLTQFTKVFWDKRSAKTIFIRNNCAQTFLQ